MQTYLIVTAFLVGACGFVAAWLIQKSKLVTAKAIDQNQIDGLQARNQSLEKDVALERTAITELRALHIGESRARASAEALAGHVPQLRAQIDELQGQIKDHAVRAAELDAYSTRW